MRKVFIAVPKDFSLLETLDNGKPINESRADIDVCIDVMEFYAGSVANQLLL